MARQRDEMLAPRTERGEGRVEKSPQHPGHTRWKGSDNAVSSRLGCWECVLGWFGEMRKLEDAPGCVCQHPCAPAEKEVEDEE